MICSGLLAVVEVAAATAQGCAIPAAFSQGRQRELLARHVAYHVNAIRRAAASEPN